MTKPYETNQGNSAVLTHASRVTNQYGAADHGYLGAIAEWRQVFDTRSGVTPDNDQYQIFNVQTLLGNYTLPAEVTGRKLAILGRVVWGIGGAQMQCDFDWKVGSQFSVGGSFMRIEAAFSETEDAPEEVKVSAMFASGSRAARSQMTRTFPQVRISGDGEGATEICIIPIPPFAHAVNLFADDTDFYTADEATIRFVGGVSTNYSAATTDLASFVTDGIPFLDALANEDGVRFPEAAKFIELSTVANAAYLITACFTLSL